MGGTDALLRYGIRDYNDETVSVPFEATASDKCMMALIKLLENWFPDTKAELPKELQPFWRVRDDGVVYMETRIVITKLFRPRILDTLHSAHQGVTSMRMRADKSIFWPRMAQDIANKRQGC